MIPYSYYDSILEALKFYAYRHLPDSNDHIPSLSLGMPPHLGDWFDDPIEFAIKCYELGVLYKPCSIKLKLVYEDMGASIYCLIFKVTEK